jgi:hypothetical protein
LGLVSRGLSFGRTLRKRWCQLKLRQDVHHPRLREASQPRPMCALSTHAVGAALVNVRRLVPGKITRSNNANWAAFFDLKSRTCVKMTALSKICIIGPTVEPPNKWYLNGVWLESWNQYSVLSCKLAEAENPHHHMRPLGVNRRACVSAKLIVVRPTAVQDNL